MDGERFDRFSQLLSQRWAETCAACRVPPSWVRWDIGEYAHFLKPRGYGVTFHMGTYCHLRFAEKILSTSSDRADGVIRHELGHVLDMLVPSVELDSWASRRGVLLPKTPERRADAVAYAIWKQHIRYDPKLLVQSTTKGVMLRPKHLGL